MVDKNIIPTLQKIKKTKAMNRRNAIYVRHLDLDPQTAPDTELDDDLDDYDYYNNLDDDD